MHVIDVNGNPKSRLKKESRSHHSSSVNLEAAEEIARQLRLRDMGGIIIVDFIDLQSEKNKRTLFQKMKEFMEDDKAKHHVLPPTKFGLIQITRQKLGLQCILKHKKVALCVQVMVKLIQAYNLLIKLKIEYLN